MILWCARFLVFVGLLATTTHARGEPFTREQLEFFENRVRPLLVEQCFECHSQKSAKLQGGLRLDRRELAVRGGESGAAIVPGKPDESLLVAAVRWKSFEMPPGGKLKDAQIATLVEWVAMGAPWPAEDAPPPIAAKPGEYDWAKWRREHWAFQPIARSAPPDVRDVAWIQSPVDRFVLSGLERESLRPARPADPRTLARRLYFDLVGFPPTPQRVVEFAAAYAQDRDAAVRTLVDDLLASPHYGERWGRHWLDVARYCDGYGGFLDNATYGEAWRYRDWVVRAWNEDRPFDEFLRAQIAGDLSGVRDDAAATGFFALGPNYISDGGDPDSVAQARAETLSDRLDTLGQGMLGLTIACSRCHDHKFDPLPQQDYYGLAGVFNHTATREYPLAPDDVVRTYQERQQAIGESTKRLNELKKSIADMKREATADEKRQIDEQQAMLAELQKTAPAKYPVAHALHDTGSGDMPIAIRGNLRNNGPLAPRRFPRILAGDDAPHFKQGSGRQELADAVTSPANPLAARVFVNRLWMHHFGQGIVRTPNNFGALGERPTHPELLDWLATLLRESRSIKTVQRAILTSAAYQMSSDQDDAAFARDGDNRLVWRMNPRRLDAEAWRDSLLAVTGELDLAVGGPPIDDVGSRRRTLYFRVSRNGDAFATDEFLRLFDFPLMRASVAQRPTSVVPQQYLFLLNSPFMVQRSRAFVTRLDRESTAAATTKPTTDDDKIERAYRLLYQRSPTAEELAAGREFLRTTTVGPGNLSAWEQYAQVLLGANEFLFVR